MSSKIGSLLSIPILSGSMAQISRWPISPPGRERFMRAFSGPYETPVGIIQPAGADVQIRTIDVLTFTDEKISAVWVNADDLGMLRQLGWRP
jgi:SnoaL-like polyketide cyclase